MTDATEKGGVGILGKAAEAVGAVAGTVKEAVAGGSAAGFVENARMGDLYETAAAAIALRRSQSPEVHLIAQTVLDDHTTSSHQLMSALRMHESGGGALPIDLDMHRQTMLDHLHEAKDEEFDQLFLDQQAAATSEAMTLFEGYAMRGDNPQLASFARGAIPALVEHRAMVEAMRG